jgi:hypothetical protein
MDDKLTFFIILFGWKNYLKLPYFELHFQLDKNKSFVMKKKKKILGNPPDSEFATSESCGLGPIPTEYKGQMRVGPYLWP